MKILNALEKVEGAPPVAREGLQVLLRVLSPITPHVAHHLWRELGFGEDIMRESWPDPDPAALDLDQINYVVQINGKTRGNVLVAAGLSDEETASVAIAGVKQYIGDKQVQRKIVVKGRLVNLVVK
jgi:leucyl-tRNA synthetase